jgi:YD repeat-containing protein
MKIILVLFVLVVLQCAFCASAPAQAGPSCIGWIGNGCLIGGYNSGACPGWFNCQPTGPWLIICQAMTSLCAPPDAAAETRCGAQCSTASLPISLATGNTYIEEQDVSLAGLSGGLRLVRTWNSMWPSSQSATQVGLFGPNWRSNYEERVFVGTDNYVKYARGDGSFWSFGVGGPGWSVAAPANAGATLIEGPSYWTLTLKNGEQRLFDNASGHLLTIIDRNGNQTQLTYDAVGRLTTVTDPVSRHLYFNYPNGSSLLVSSVTSDFGVTVSYSYDAQGRSLQVTEPDLSTFNFQYNSNSLISAVVDSNAKIIESHTYDSLGRGLTSSRANGVEALTISYATQ